MSDFASSLSTAAQAVIALGLVVGVGACVRWRIPSVMTPEAKVILSNLAVNVLLPSSLLISTVAAVNTDATALRAFLTMPAAACVMNLLGMGIGWICGKVIEHSYADPKHEFSPLHMACIVGLGNHAYLALLLLPSFLQQNCFGRPESPELLATLSADIERGNGLIAAWLLYMNIVTFAVVWAVLDVAAKHGRAKALRLAKPGITLEHEVYEIQDEAGSREEEEEDTAAGSGHRSQSPSPPTAAAEMTSDDHEVVVQVQGISHCKDTSETKVIQKMPSNSSVNDDINELDLRQDMSSSTSQIGIDSAGAAAAGSAAPLALADATQLSGTEEEAEELPHLCSRHTFLQIWQKARSPPVIATLVGLICGLIPPVRDALVSGNVAHPGVLEPTFSYSFKTIGAAVTPLTLMILGGNLFDAVHKQHQPTPRLVLVTAVTAKLIIMPAIGFGLIWASVEIGLVPRDPIMLLLMFIQNAAPTAINLTLVTELVQYGQSATAMIMLLQYGAAMITITCWLSASLWAINSHLAPGAFSVVL